MRPGGPDVTGRTISFRGGRVRQEDAGASRAIVIADLGFGDSGKGSMTDYLVRHTGARLVVRYNGGAQAGHTVVTADGREHTFSQLGSGTFVEGVRTHLSRFMIVHPTGLLVELKHLAELGVDDALERLTMSPECRLITPFQQAANRLRELLRGHDRHGSCGLGVGETMQDGEDSLRAWELASPRLARRKLVRLQARKWAELAPFRRQLDPAELGVLESRAVGERWLESVRDLLQRVAFAEDLPPRSGPLVLEGAQGVLLDEWRGFHPHTTWSTCTFDNALELLRDWPGQVVRLGVLRSYATRHGAGPFPTEDPRLDWPEPHNRTGPWQGAFRRGWPDAVLGRYAVAACGGLDALALTHMDRCRDGWRLAFAYRDGELALGPFRDLDYQTRLNRRLNQARPVYRTVHRHELAEALAAELQVPLWIESWGPRAQDKREVAPLAKARR